MTYNSKLGVCIPTYKRPEQLRACIQSIIRSIGSHNVPIFISDDSTDNTNVAIIQALQSEYPFIIHDRNPANLGIDRNILKSVDICTCQYAWIVGEDDRMVPEAIQTVLSVIEKSDAEWPFIYANYSSVDESLKLVLKEKSLPLKQDTTMKAESFFETDAWSIGFIGGCIINHRLWQTAHREPYLGTYFAHAGMILEFLKERELYMIASPLVLNRCGSARIFTWSHSTFEVMYGWLRMTKALEPLYGVDACRKASDAMDDAHGTGSMIWYGYLRADRAFTLDAFRKHVLNAPHPPIYKCGAWLIAITPPQVFQSVRWALTYFRRCTCRNISGYN